MTEKRFTTNGYKIYDTFHDGTHWLVNQVEADEIVDKMNNLDNKARERSKALSKLQKENEQLKKENQRMTDKLNELALEFLNYDMVSMGKATEISEMCYYDFLKYRKDNGNPMELQL